jgi:hypothetical protein
VPKHAKNVLPSARNTLTTRLVKPVQKHAAIVQWNAGRSESSKASAIQIPTAFRLLLPVAHNVGILFFE